MRKIVLMPMFVIAMACCVGEETSTEEGQTLSLSTNIITLDRDGAAGAVGSTNTITVTSSDNWILTVSASWCVASATSGANGDAVTITADVNNTDSDRQAELVFICGNVAERVTVYQIAGLQVEYLVVEEVYGIPSAATTIAMRIWSNVDAASQVEITGDWITMSRPSTVTVGEQWLSFFVDANSDFQSRAGYITFFGGTDAERTVTINQGLYYGVRTDDPTDYEVDPEGMSFNVTIRGNVEFSASPVDLAANWVTVQETSSGTVDELIQKVYTITCAATQYSRAGVVEITPVQGSIININISQISTDPVLVDIPDPVFVWSLLSNGYIIERESGMYEVTYEGSLATSMSLSATDGQNYLTLASVEGIEYFPSIEELTFYYTQVSRLDLSRNTNLTNLSVTAIPLEYLNLGDCNITTQTLSYLSTTYPTPIYAESLTVISSQLQTLTANESDRNWDRVAWIDVTGCPALTTLNCTRVEGVLQTIYIAEGQNVNVTTRASVQIVRR